MVDLRLGCAAQMSTMMVFHKFKQPIIIVRHKTLEDYFNKELTEVIYTWIEKREKPPERS